MTQIMNHGQSFQNHSEGKSNLLDVGFEGKRNLFFGVDQNSMADRNSIGFAIAGLMTAVEGVPFVYRDIETQTSTLKYDYQKECIKSVKDVYSVGIVDLQDQDTSKSLFPASPVVVANEYIEECFCGCTVQMRNDFAHSYDYVFDFLEELKDIQYSGVALDDVVIQTVAMHCANDVLKTSSYKKPYCK